MPSCCKRMEPSNVQRGQFSGSLNSGKRMPSLNEQSTWPLWTTVKSVPSVSSVWGEGPEAIVLVGSVLFAACCLPIPLSSLRWESWQRHGGWMWQADLFVEPGSPTGAGNTSRCFHWLRAPRMFLLLLAHLAPYVLIVAGVGTTGSRGTPGGDHHTCASALLVFPLFCESS